MDRPSDGFPWPPYYGHFRFFEQRMNTHSHVAALQACGDGIYELTNKYSRTLRVFICECYSFGAAEYVETKDTLGSLDAIVINSAWCGYTAGGQAPRSGRQSWIVQSW
jgi:hypothetical protein